MMRIAPGFAAFLLLSTAPTVQGPTLPPEYRGFRPGMPYREFSERARALARGDQLRCNTSANTAQLMECGVPIRDPRDSARYYLSAYVIEGKVAMVALYDSAGCVDNSGAALHRRTKSE